MFFQVLWPSLISAAALSAANMVDAVALGNRMGENGLAAIGLVTPLYMIYNVVGLAISTGGGVTHSSLTAAGKEQEALVHFRSLGILALSVGILFAVLGNVLMEPILRLLGAGKAQQGIMALCEEYARPVFTSAPIFMLNYLLYDFVRCDNGTRLAALGFSVGCIVDVALNILFVMVLGLGLRGSAWATVIAQSVSVGIMLLHFFGDNGVLHVRRLCTTHHGGGDEPYLVERSVKLGFSTSARYIFQFLFLMQGNRLLLNAGKRGIINGEIYVAVFDVVMNVSYFAYGIYQAYSDTMQPLAATYHAEHDADDLRYLLRLAIRHGLMVGLTAGALLCLLAKPVSQLFGLTDPKTLEVSVRAIPIFCLSTPFAGVTIILTGFYQSTGQAKLASLATSFRTLVFLLPLTYTAGRFFPHEFWWLFLASEVGSLGSLVVAASINGKKAAAQQSAQPPVFTATMDRSRQELGQVMEQVTAFCEEQQIPVKKALLIEQAVEEFCLVTQEKAFTGKPDEYICLTLAEEENGDYVLHIRNSAAYFNPLDMRMERVKADSETELLDAIGVLMVKIRVKDLHFRNYQGFNVMTVRI